VDVMALHMLALVALHMLSLGGVAVVLVVHLMNPLNS